VRKGRTKKPQRKSDEWKEEAEGDGYQLEKHQVAGNTRPVTKDIFTTVRIGPPPSDSSYYQEFSFCCFEPVLIDWFFFFLNSSLARSRDYGNAFDLSSTSIRRTSIVICAPSEHCS
jgi:hypothetical protein